MVRLSWPGWWLGLLVGIGSPVAAQANVGPPRVELKENYPNPFFPATTIPFEIGPEVCAKGRQPVVSLKIYNVLVQVVAIPVLPGSDERGTVSGSDVGCIVPIGMGSTWTARRGYAGRLLLPVECGRRAVHSEDDRPRKITSRRRGDEAVVPTAFGVSPYRQKIWEHCLPRGSRMTHGICNQRS